MTDMGDTGAMTPETDPNGAVQVDLPEPGEPPLKVFLAGPIKQWWSEWGSARHAGYTAWRDQVRLAVVAAGHLVYSPHRAWQGAWHEDAQRVNDTAIAFSDVMLVLTPPDCPAEGTAAEEAYARAHGVPTRACPPPGGSEATDGALRDLLAALADLKAAR